MHITLSSELKQNLVNYVKLRKPGSSVSAVLREAGELLLELEDRDPIKQQALRTAIDNKISVPKTMPYKSVYVFLYMLAQAYSDMSAKEFWNVLYVSSLDKTHKQVLIEIQDEMKNTLKRLNGA